MNPRPPLFRVGLLLTERCDVACSHCWFGSSPEKKSDMTGDGIRRYVDEANADGARWISFTGGEPFLVYDALKEAVGYATKQSLLKEAVTNCNWAESGGIAHEKLKPLKAAGLDVLNISVDDFHQEHIPLDRVKNCYEAAKALRLKPVLMIAVKRGNRITAETVGELLEDLDIQVLGRTRVQSPSALAMETAFTPVGRGANLPKDEWLIEHEAAEGPCRHVLTDIGVKPGGDVLACCGPLGTLREAVLGNLEEENIGTILDRAWSDERLRRIYERGPAPAEGCYVNRCHRCYSVFGED
ncbi:radical SAM protein [Candidatus Bathyarchaeota archaeon]|nr:radical SAM protein [Candidatus Bathyarchaeota archaeon]